MPNRRHPSIASPTTPVFAWPRLALGALTGSGLRVFAFLAGRFGTLGLDLRLGLLILIAAIPLFALQIAGFVVDRREAVDEAGAGVVVEARLYAAKAATLLTRAEELLTLLSGLDTIRDTSDPHCHLLMARMLDVHPQLNGIGIVDPDMTMRCHSIFPDVSPFAEPELYARAMAAGSPRLVLGEFFIGPLTRKGGVVAAMALPKSPEGSSRGVIFARFDLAAFSATQTDLDPSRVGQAMLLDPRGHMILALTPDPGHRIGSSFRDEPLLEKLVAAPPSGAVQGSALGGPPGVFGVAALSSAMPGSPVVVVARSAATILASSDHHFVVRLVMSVVVTALAMTTAVLLGRDSIGVSVGKLLTAATRFGDGDFTARAELEPSRPPEFRQLGDSLNAMAARVAEAQAGMREREAEWRILADHSSDMIIKLDANFRRIYVSPAAREILGKDPDELTGLTPPTLVHPADQGRMDAVLAGMAAGQDQARDSYRLRHADGRWIWAESNMRALRHPETGQFLGVLGAVRDISRAKAMQDALNRANDQLRSWALQDGLTGLANRRSFDETIQSELRRAARDGLPLGVLMVDVDHFKLYNDRYGHQMGDDCLRMVANTIAAVIDRPGDLVARYGGEEFAVILPDTDAEEIVALAERLRRAIADRAIDHGGSAFGHVTISVGCACWIPGPGAAAGTAAEPNRLIAVADRNLYAAKLAGRNRVVTDWLLARAG